ncbi:MAG: SDR family oxidoreductase, partial [Nitrospira sp.]|nr:SDR family oxidoreductase [Nitrospira sp.]
MTSKDFSGKTALITGGSRGIGRAIACKLAQHGANIAINYVSRDQDALVTQELVEREGVQCLLVKGDVSNPSDVATMVARTRKTLDPIGFLVTSAAISILESHKQISWETWKKTMSVNIDGTYLPIMAVKDEMLENQYGRILCLSSVAALLPRPMQIHYSSSKAAVISMVRCFAAALAPHVRINCIAPGLIETEMGALLGPDATQAIITAT